MIKVPKKKRKVLTRFKKNIWVPDLAAMGSLCSSNYGIKNLLCVIDFFTKNAWVKLMKYKKGKTVLHGFI